MCETHSFKIWLIQIIVVLGLIAFFMWIALRPKNPSFYIVDVTVPVSNTTANQTMPTGTLGFDLDIENPNKESSIFYEDILLTFTYNDEEIGESEFPSFNQGKGKKTKKSSRVDINQKILRKLIDDVSNKTANMKVNLNTMIRLKTLGVKSKRKNMHMEGVFDVGLDGKLKGEKKKIKLKHASNKSKRIKRLKFS